jgi:hypothetical protein
MFRPVGGPIKPPREGNERQVNGLTIRPDCKCTPAGAMAGKGMPLMIGWSFAKYPNNVASLRVLL